MTHNRKLVLGGVALTKARNNRQDISVMREVADELEILIDLTGYLNDAPFKWISLILRFGLKNDNTPSYQRINKKYGDLPIAIELDTHEIRYADHDELKRLFMIATLKALIHVGEKYNLPVDEFVERKNQLISIIE